MRENKTLHQIIVNNERLCEIRESLAVRDAGRGKKFFKKVKNKILSLQETNYGLAFRFCREVISDYLGNDFSAAYWMAGYDIIPALELGGKWTFLSSGYSSSRRLSADENRLYSKSVGADINKDIRGNIKLLSYLIPEYETEIALPEGISEVDLSMIKTPGDSYPTENKQGGIAEGWLAEMQDRNPDFSARDAVHLKNNLWALSHKLLKQGGVLILTEKMHQDYEEKYKQIGKRLKLEHIIRRGISFCSIGNGDIPETITIYQKIK